MICVLYWHVYKYIYICNNSIKLIECNWMMLFVEWIKNILQQFRNSFQSFKRVISFFLIKHQSQRNKTDAIKNLQIKAWCIYNKKLKTRLILNYEKSILTNSNWICRLWCCWCCCSRRVIVGIIFSWPFVFTFGYLAFLWKVLINNLNFLY